MVKVAPNQIEFTLGKALEYNGILIYGQDYGMVQLRAEKVLNQFFPEKIDNFRYFDYQFEEIKEDEERLISSIKSISFIKGRKCIRIKGMTASLPKNIKAALDEVSKGEFVIMLADDLPASSSLRKYAEDNPNFISIPCYKQEAVGIKAKIQAFIRNNQISVEGNLAEILNYLETVFSADSMIMESELEKIAIAAKSQPLTLDLVEELVGNSLDSKIDELIFAIFDNRIADAIKHYDNVIDEISEVGLTRYMMNYINRIMDIKIQAEKNNLSVNDAVKNQRPPIFFKLVPVYVKYSSNFNLSQLKKFIARLNEAEYLAKSFSQIPIIYKNHILNLAKSL
ncbi:MAG: DNA polymerase III subunit delta [Alphaproteobacteria bacterium]|nr:DNA polymerase III subunit delta [Alphaproteobacteria bacterium]OJV15336.1 MAG: DNA polymerase III subunit delta [Alphaproteobacteria bacterium 33-17]